MKLRTSYFNITALRKDIFRFAPVWAIYLIGGLLIGINTVTGYGMLGSGANELAQTIAPLAIVNMLYAIICAELLFGDLFNGRLCNALHAFPLRREGWFITHSVAGLLFSFVPNLIMSLFFMPFMDGMWYVSLIWLLGMTLEFLFFFGLAAFCAMCTGNRFAMAAVYFLINFLSLIILWFTATIYAPLFRGVIFENEVVFYWFCPVAQMVLWRSKYVQFNYVTDDSLGIYDYYAYEFAGLSSDWWYPVLLAVLGLALLGAAVLLYRKRKLESAGDFVAFHWLKPIITVLFTLSAGALFEMFGNAFLDIEYVCLTIGIIVGYFVIKMLLQRTVKVFCKRAFLECAAIGIGLVLTIVIAWLDPFGIESWVPKVDQVESVTVSQAYYFDWNYDKSITLRESEDIESITRAHEQILAEGDSDTWRTALDDYTYGDVIGGDYAWISEYGPVDNVYLIYRMKDGREVARRYDYLVNGEAGKLLNSLYSRPEYVLEYEDWDAFLADINYVELDWYADGGWDNSFIEKDAFPLLEAVKADCLNGTMAQNRNDEPKRRLWIRGDHCNFNLNIYEDCENTLNWLDDHFAWWKY